MAHLAQQPPPPTPTRTSTVQVRAPLRCVNAYQGGNIVACTDGELYSVEPDGRHLLEQPPASALQPAN